ncbi:MAG: helix-turn-helix transcriptional regulator [Planctomycetota bacterium]|jgi:DNA-binding CsgD family transcriptional regulator|nr:MAG: helix-turn-helix transcriptional regulator [Planctomycetota bacterium]
MRALVQGLARKDVANRLGLSVHTVGTMCKRGYAKLGVRSHAELVAKLAGGET